jgi:prepilin peptidase CpaA
MNVAWQTLGQTLVVYVPLLALVAVAAVTDARARRIPNWLTATVALAGLAQSLAPWHVITALQSVYGLLAGFGITFLLYIIGGRGGGDVKLTAGIGAWLGPAAVVIVLLVAAVVSLISALITTTAQGKLLKLFKSAALMLLVVGNVRRVGAANVTESLRGWKSIGRPLPNGVSMLVATIGVVVWVAGAR